MADKKEKLIERIKEHRPNLKDSSLQMYLRNLAKINKDNDIADLYNVSTLEDTELVNEYLSTKKENTQKNYLASIVVILMAYKKKKSLIDFYRNKMEILGNTIKEFTSKQEKTPKQMENWADLKDLQKVVSNYKKQIDSKELLDKDYDSLTKKEQALLKMWLVGSLYVLDPQNNPPLRADYGSMKILKNNEYNDLSKEELKKNYLVVIGPKKKFFSLGAYKTEGKFGVQQIQVGTKLNNVINKYLMNYGREYLITDSQDKPMTDNQLSKFVIKTFSPTKKNVGISLLRHIVISHLFPPQTKDKEELASKMLHSKNQQNEYAKND